MTEPRILFLDIETSYISVVGFQLNMDYVSPSNILEDWRIICAAWKWQGQKKVHASWDIEDDLQVCIDLRDAIAKADMVVHHNGDKFDMKKLNARLIKHGIDPFPTVVSVDTLKVARKEFKFTSNRLDYIGKYLGCGGKIVNEPGLWRKVYEGDEAALKRMVRYNKRDVTLLEEVYEIMRPYITNHPKLIPSTNEARRCQGCGSASINLRGYAIKRSGLKYQKYQCQSCGMWGQDKNCTKPTTN